MEPEKTIADLEKTHKLCVKCNCYISRSDFYYHESSKDKLRSYCKNCDHKSSALRNRADPDRAIKDKARFSTEQGRADKLSQVKRYHEKYPERYKARQELNRAIRNGIIIQKPCKVCGFCITEAHHDDYSKPLDVIWLCKKHHAERHRKY